MRSLRLLLCALLFLIGCSSAPAQAPAPTLELPQAGAGGQADAANQAGAPAQKVWREDARAAGGEPGAIQDSEAGATGAAGAEAEAPNVPLTVHRVWGVGQSVMDGPALGSPPPECPLSAVLMWNRDGTGNQEPGGQNFDAFTALQQPAGAGHGGELQCGVDLWKAGYTNIQIKIAKGATSIAMWSPVGQYYPWVQEEVPQIIAASNTAYPGATFVDHLVFNCGQYEATASVEDYALVHTYYIGQVRLGYETLLGHAFASVHIEVTQQNVGGGTAQWINDVRAQQLAVPGAYFTYYDDVPTSDGTHPYAAGQNIIGARRALSIQAAINAPVPPTPVAPICYVSG